MSCHYSIKLLAADLLSDEGIANVTCIDSSKAQPFETIQIKYQEKEKEFSATNYWEAFKLARVEFEAERLLFYCYAAAINVHPSAMCLDMGSGKKAYIHTLGKQAKMENLINIFDVSTDLRIGTIAEQNKFYEKWRESLTPSKNA